MSFRRSIKIKKWLRHGPNKFVYELVRVLEGEKLFCTLAAALLMIRCMHGSQLLHCMVAQDGDGIQGSILVPVSQPTLVCGELPGQARDP